MDTTRIAVLGGTGKTGRLLLNHLTGRSRLEISALVRPGSVDLPDGLRVVEGSATNSAAVAETIKSATAIVTLVAAPIGREVGTVRSQSTRALLDALADARDAAHLIVVGALGGKRNRSQQRAVARWLYPTIVGAKRLSEVDLQEQLLETVSLPVTLVRPPRLDDRPGTGAIEITTPVGLSARLHRADLAQKLADLAMGPPPVAPRAVTLVSR